MEYFLIEKNKLCLSQQISKVEEIEYCKSEVVGVESVLNSSTLLVYLSWTEAQLHSTTALVLVRNLRC